MVHRSGRKHANADTLSHLPLESNIDEPTALVDVLLLGALTNPLLAAESIAKMTKDDTAIHVVCKCVEVSDVALPEKSIAFWPYETRSLELLVRHGLVVPWLWLGGGWELDELHHCQQR